MDPTYTVPYSGTAALWIDGAGNDMGLYVQGIGGMLIPLLLAVALCLGIWLSMKVLP